MWEWVCVALSVYVQNLLGLFILIVVSASDHGLSRLVEAFRTHGHKAAKINPLLPQKPVLDSVPEIDMLRGIIQGPLNTSGGKWKPAGRRQSAWVYTLKMWGVFVTSVQTNIIQITNKPPTLVLQVSTNKATRFRRCVSSKRSDLHVWAWRFRSFWFSPCPIPAQPILY